MPSFIKVRSNNRNMSYLNLRPSDESVELRATASGFGVEIGIPWYLLEEEQTEIEAGEALSFYIGDVKPKTWHTEIHVNPALHAFGFVSHPTLLEPGDEVPIFINFTATQLTDLKKIEWLVRIYLRD